MPLIGICCYRVADEVASTDYSIRAQSGIGRHEHDFSERPVKVRKRLIMRGKIEGEAFAKPPQGFLFAGEDERIVVTSEKPVDDTILGVDRGLDFQSAHGQSKICRAICHVWGNKVKRYI